jgi:hypothetical protein
MGYERPKWWTCAGSRWIFKTASLRIRRAKNGTPATHPLSGLEMRELRRHQREMHRQKKRVFSRVMPN